VDTLKELMGGPSIDNGIELDNMFCTMPSSTFSSHASIYTVSSFFITETNHPINSFAVRG